MQNKRVTNAEIIREIASSTSGHTNKWIQDEVSRKYKRFVTIQQIQQVLGRTKERILTVDKYVGRKAYELLTACGNDVGLAVRVMKHMVGNSI